MDRFRSFRNDFHLICIFVFEISKGRSDDDAGLLLLAVTGGHTAAAVSGIKVIHQSLEANGYAPNDSKHRTCQAVAARMGRKEREKAQDHPVKAVCDTRCNTIDHHLRSGKIDKEFAATAKRIAREKKNRALRDNEYFLGKYEADMTQDAIYTETEQRLGRPPRRECLCPT